MVHSELGNQFKRMKACRSSIDHTAKRFLSCLDGLNPWSKNKATYSMWPIVLGQLNLPRQIRYQFANFLLVGIIRSQTEGSEPKDLEPYLDVLVD